MSGLWSGGGKRGVNGEACGLGGGEGVGEGWGQSRCARVKSERASRTGRVSVGGGRWVTGEGGGPI